MGVQLHGRAGLACWRPKAQTPVPLFWEEGRELRSRFACFPNDAELIFQVYLYIFPSQLNLNPEIVRFDPRTLSVLGKVTIALFVLFCFETKSQVAQANFEDCC